MSMTAPVSTHPLLFLTTDELAQRWLVAPKTIARWRRERIGPRFHKLGKRVVYAHLDVQQFEEDHMSGPKPATVQVTSQ